MASAMRGLAFMVACGAALVAAQGAAAASDPFYDGKQLDFVSSSAPGGGYDAYARLISRHLPRQLGVKAVVVQNMPGAGGIRATQHLFNTAAKTGLVIGMVTNNVPFTPLYEEKQWGFDATKFNWLGSPNRETHVGSPTSPTTQELVDWLSGQAPPLQYHVRSHGRGGGGET